MHAAVTVRGKSGDMMDWAHFGSYIAALDTGQPYGQRSRSSIVRHVQEMASISFLHIHTVPDHVCRLTRVGCPPHTRPKDC